MSAYVEAISRTEAARLISETEWFKLEENDAVKFRAWLRASPKLWVGAIEDRLVCLWGILAPTLLSETAYLWLHTTDALKGNEFVFVRQSQRVIAEMRSQYPRIVGHCVVGEEQSIRWLKFLGARFLEPDGRLVPFEIKARADG